MMYASPLDNFDHTFVEICMFWDIFRVLLSTYAIDDVAVHSIFQFSFVFHMHVILRQLATIMSRVRRCGFMSEIVKYGI